MDLIVLCFERKPNKVIWTNIFSIYGSICVRRIYSNNLPKFSSRLIGQYEEIKFLNNNNNNDSHLI